MKTVKTATIPLAVALLLCGCRETCETCTLPPATLGKGGTTFDFEAISAKRFAGIFDPARNVVKVPVAAHLTGPWSKSFALPTTNGGLWRVSCRYRMKHSQSSRNVFTVSPDGPQCVIRDTGGEWKELSACAQVPPGTDSVTVNFRLVKDSVAFDFKDLAIIDETPSTPIALLAPAADYLDGAFAVPVGQVCNYELLWRKVERAGTFPAENFSVEVALPPGVEYAGANFAASGTVKTQAKPDGSSVTTFRMRPGACALLDNYVSGNSLSVLVRGVGKVGMRGRGQVTFTYGHREQGRTFRVAAKPVEFFTVEPIKAALPKAYANGIKPGGIFNGLGDEANVAFARSLVDYGVTWMVQSGDARLYEIWRKAGISRITPPAWRFNNGYSIGEAGKIPECDRFVALAAPGKPIKMDGAVCPVTVYEGSAFFRNSTAPFIRNFVKGSDGCWANWEPWMFRRKGCFCDRCCRKFAAYVGKPYDEVKAKWPACVMKGGEWYDVEPKFRTVEHAKVVRTLDRIVREATGGEASLGFIPGIAWIEMSSWWRPNNHAPDIQAIAYAGEMKWMNPWGPYCAWESAYPYVYAKRKPLCHFFAAKDVRETVDADYPAGHRPKLMALPQGHQCRHWLTQPEHIEMALDSYFFNGWEATVEYYFPRGYDARWWRAFANATTRAAKYERFVREGRRVDAQVTLTPRAGTYAANVRHLSAYLPDVPEELASPLQCAAWKLGDRMIVAVFNFWQKGEAFFNLKAAGLSGKVAIVDEAATLRATRATQTRWEAAALAGQGVDLAVPASRCRVFEFRGEDDIASATSLMTDETLERLYLERKSDLERAAKEDAAYEDGSGPVGKEYMPVI